MYAASASDGSAHHACFYKNTGLTEYHVLFDETARNNDPAGNYGANDCYENQAATDNSFGYAVLNTAGNTLTGFLNVYTDGGTIDFFNTSPPYTGVTNGAYIVRDSELYCWSVTVNGTTITGVAEATNQSYNAVCNNINPVRASLNTTYLTISLLGLTAIFIRRKYKIKLVKN
ncbi:hypothetical protein QUF74_17295 [Candidatus Halobeggiatoa sp. HSG11]|nr:hypothetical protein [Candidatus Halobeggiatoa sp. HSG11]